MAGKMKIQIYIDAEIYEAFRNYVYSKYGTFHKYLGEELTRALEVWLKDHQNAHTRS